MLKTLLIGGLLLLTLFAVAPAQADPVTLTCPDTDVQDDGFAYCHFTVGNGRGCIQVNLSGDNRHCT
jgi:hypothetical protein